MGEWDTGSFDGATATTTADYNWDCQITARRNGTVAHSTGDCCLGCRQRAEIDRGKIVEVKAEPASPVRALPEPKVGFWSSVFRSSEKVK